MAERRHSARQKSFLRGRIYYNKRRGAVDCLIRDISEEGARVIFSDTVSIPDAVELYIPQKEQTLRAHVQWRHGEEIGLAFPDNVAAGEPATGDLAERVARLESEIAALRRAIRHIKSELPGSNDEAA